MLLIKKCLLVCLVLGAWSTNVYGQITITYTFTDGTTASAVEVNTNFSQLASAALNRTGGTITGNIAVNAGVTIDGVDISALSAALGNYALLNAVNTFTALGNHSWNASGTGVNSLSLNQLTAGTGNLSRITLGTDAINNLFIEGYSSTYTPSGVALANGASVNGPGVGGLSIAATSASGSLRFYSGGTTQRGEFDTAGNWRLGTNIADGMSTPTISSGFGTGATIVGKASFFTVTHGTTASAGGVVLFNTTFASAPVCVTGQSGSVVTPAEAPISTVVTTTQVTLTFAATNTGNSGSKYQVICRGY